MERKLINEDREIERAVGEGMPDKIVDKISVFDIVSKSALDDFLLNQEENTDAYTDDSVRRVLNQIIAERNGTLNLIQLLSSFIEEAQKHEISPYEIDQSFSVNQETT